MFFQTVGTLLAIAGIAWSMSIFMLFIVGVLGGSRRWFG